jgi:hypothetical protein
MSMKIMIYVKCIQCNQKFSFPSEIEKIKITERIKSPWLDLAWDYSGQIPVRLSYCPLCFNNNMSIPEFKEWLRSSNFKIYTG